MISFSPAAAIARPNRDAKRRLSFRRDPRARNSAYCESLYKLRLFIETSRTDDLSKPEAPLLSPHPLLPLSRVFYARLRKHIKNTTDGVLLSKEGKRRHRGGEERVGESRG